MSVLLVGTVEMYFLAKTALSEPNTEKLTGNLSCKGYSALKIWKAP